MVRLFSYAVPVVLLAALLLSYLIWPKFYLTCLLQKEHREYQAVELITVVSALTASVLLLTAAARLWRVTRRPGPDRTGWLDRRGGALIIAVLALATFFFAGEEASWGQTYLGFQTPETYEKASGNSETNLHNTSLNIQGLGSVFLAVMFFGLPIAWVYRVKLNLPAGWAPAIAEGPVIFCLALGFGWKLFKDVYRRCCLTGPDGSDRFYIEFVEQINEQKEMLVGVALLIYGLYRLRAVRRFVANQTNVTRGREP